MDVKLDASAAQKKYPLYRLAIISLELLDRKHCEMHPSWLSFAVKLTAFLVTFFAVEKSDWHVGPPPTTLDFKTQKTEAKIQNITLLLKFKKVPPIPLGDNPSGTAGQKTLRDAPVVVKLRR